MHRTLTTLISSRPVLARLRQGLQWTSLARGTPKGWALPLPCLMREKAAWEPGDMSGENPLAARKWGPRP